MTLCAGGRLRRNHSSIPTMWSYHRVASETNGSDNVNGHLKENVDAITGDGISEHYANKSDLKIYEDESFTGVNGESDAKQVVRGGEPISHLERLIRTNSIWFIPDLTRQEAVRFLHAKEKGVSHFLMRF